MKTPGGIRVTGTADEGLIDEAMIWTHTAPSLIGVVLQEAEQYHNMLITGHDGIKIFAVGMVTWYVTNAMPYRRGSSAVAEWYNLAAIKAFELDLGARGGWLDLPAFRISAVTYANNYPVVYAGRYQ